VEDNVRAKPEFVIEHLSERSVVVLPGGHHGDVVVGAAQRTDDRREFDDFGTGAERYKQPHLVNTSSR
jgi:hypothetical protein